MAAPVRALSVEESTRLSPNIIRLALVGDSLADFPEGFEGGYVKLLFDRRGEPLRRVDGDVRAAVRRSYTVRSVDQGERMLLLDAALHAVRGGREGPATRWIGRAKPGDEIAVAGPGSVKRLSADADHVVAIADPTSLPALAVNLERLSSNARGFAIVEVLSGQDRQDLRAPEGVSVHWVVNPSPSRDQSPLAEALLDAEWPSGRVSFWGAGEFHAMRLVRRYLREQNVARDDLYCSSYWKLGATDEEHKRAKRKEQSPG
ncbi:MAG: siderophore-interacting protein [Myxococcota bacterium]